jgi:hypothetical protein
MTDHGPFAANIRTHAALWECKFALGPCRASEAAYMPSRRLPKPWAYARCMAAKSLIRFGGRPAGTHPGGYSPGVNETAIAALL